MRMLLKDHADRIEYAGRLPRADYVKTLRRADWVLSTARHEFYGIAVAEALLAGCLPWLPDRLSYPELVPATAPTSGCATSEGARSTSRWRALLGVL